MRVLFEELSDAARIWIYQADRALSAAEEEAIEVKANDFCEQWAAHGAPLKSSAKVYHHRFLVLAADESFNQASGCSIDSSVHMVQQLEQEFQINFFDRTKVAFLLKDEIFIESLTNLKNSVNEGKIDRDTITFNNMVESKKELESAWKVPAHATWIKRYF